MNYYNEIKEKLLQSEIYDIVRDYAKDRNNINVIFNNEKLTMVWSKLS